MSFKASAWAVDRKVGDPTAKLLLLTLAESADAERQECWPSICLLSARIESSESTVKRKLKVLVEKGLIEVEDRKRPNGSSTSRLYRLRVGVQVEPPSKALNPSPVQSSEPLPPSKALNPPLTVKENPSEEPESPQPPAAGEPKTSDHAEFIREWTDTYALQFERPYAFAGGKDAAAVKRLLKATGMPAAELIGIALKAWAKPDGFNCKQAVSIAGFASRFNEIRAELEQKCSQRSAVTVLPRADFGVDPMEWLKSRREPNGARA